MYNSYHQQADGIGCQSAVDDSHNAGMMLSKNLETFFYNFKVHVSAGYQGTGGLSSAIGSFRWWVSYNWE